MAVAYLDTTSGIAGDMTLAALVDAGADREYLLQQVRSLGLKQVELKFSETQRHCFRALQLDVVYPPEDEHRGLRVIEAMIHGSKLTERERDLSLRMFRKLGAAEAKVHGQALEEVHFHEVGAVDSIVDIVGVAVAFCSLGVDRIVASPTPTGCGTIQIAHGTVSVPAPATAELLKGVPIVESRVEAELTTPTGAAILATLADGFGPLPSMQIARIGYGAGHRALEEQANILRIMIGAASGHEEDEVVVLETNLDDMTGEQIGYAVEKLWTVGALDVFTTAIGMKKNRPAVMLSVIGPVAMRSRLEKCMFDHTSTLGIRRSTMDRSTLQREIRSVETTLGAIRVKISHRGKTSEPTFAPEYEDCKRLAEQNGQPLNAVFELAEVAARREWADNTGQVGHSHSHDHGGHDHHHH